MNKQVQQPDDQWLEALRHKMDEAQVSPPADGWTRLESALDTPKRGAVLWPWLIPAAVAAMAIFVFLWYDTTPPQSVDVLVDGGDVVLVDTASVDTVFVVPNQQLAVAMSSDKDNEKNRTHSQTSLTYIPQHKEETTELVEKEQVVHVVAMSSEPTQSEEEQAVEESSSDKPEKTTTRHKRPTRRYYTTIPWGDSPEKKHKRTYKLSLLASSGMINNENTATAPKAGVFANMDIDENVGKLYANPENALLYRAIPEYKYEHDLPIKVGVGVTISFAERWAIETGLSYTRLRSQLTDLRDDEKITQTIHYLGIPLRLNYSWLQRPTYTCYTAFGGTVERAVNARLDGEHLDVHGIQCSLEGAVGIQYKLTRLWGLFGEIGVSHYFDDDSKVETYRDEHKTSLLLNFGLRFDF